MSTLSLACQMLVKGLSLLTMLFGLLYCRYFCRWRCLVCFISLMEAFEVCFMAIQLNSCLLMTIDELNVCKFCLFFLQPTYCLYYKAQMYKIFFRTEIDDRFCQLVYSIWLDSRLYLYASLDVSLFLFYFKPDLSIYLKFVIKCLYFLSQKNNLFQKNHTCFYSGIPEYIVIMFTFFPHFWSKW